MENARRLLLKKMIERRLEWNMRSHHCLALRRHAL
ncbi:hypothetical protein FJ959_22460 [Mesorhizobium sp. B2-2-4]|nr:hypothetical protein FJ437_23510 [Mesorhizobium sp. B2-6-6]TPJ59578.1 hypothetical protein FJ443_23630 [Mesorhizobium sp. B2-6-1]TPK27034.1 hypothetical protein FJ867_27905 [Mesorhizobium sp. B2-5-3]TPK68908.1 hypothetical protein FJ551_02940 [Mesorhizobium sp. B2-5-1]TPL07434.1 hypothetical protein FJ944_21030 [Mesorhizobium sp. B2-4-11]TPL07622.1 hypothetical protein FJ952_29880 [Mesorhizobium sp. B2-4-10]TPL33189.1 hypothetical protein FJ947_19510 [Mesorhizobium sp. B2-4-8]TPL42354.1 h